MKTKKYADGGATKTKTPYTETPYMDKLRAYAERNTQNIKGLKDVAKIPKQAALTASLIPGIAGAAVADVGVNAKNFIKDKLETRRQLKSLPEEFSEPVDMSTPRPPRRELNEDQKRSMAKERDLKDRYGMKKGGSVSSASKRADGCAVKGKTRGVMR